MEHLCAASPRVLRFVGLDRFACCAVCGAVAALGAHLEPRDDVAFA